MRTPAAKTKTPARPGFFVSNSETSALAGFVALLRLVDDIDTALAADQLVVAVTAAQRLERVADFHYKPRNRWPGCSLSREIEPVLCPI